VWVLIAVFRGGYNFAVDAGLLVEVAQRLQAEGRGQGS